MIIGAQLYTLRDFCSTPSDLHETLKKVADMGITTVQLSGVCQYEGDVMSEWLKECGLSADLTHYSYDKITASPAETSAFHKRFNCPYIGIGTMPQHYANPYTEESLGRFIGEIKAVSRFYRENGQKLMYHNHNREFAIIDRADGRNVLERITDELPSEEFGITLDTYWVQYAGESPEGWLYKFKGRCDCVHFKDLSHDANGNIIMVPNGDGSVDYDKVIGACLDTGVKFAYIEQDDCGWDDPFYCLKRSYDYFRALGLS